MGPRSWERSFRSAQRSWDNLTPEDVYGPDDPEDQDGDEEEDDEE